MIKEFTEEQKFAINKAFDVQSLKINALAGTGKTTVCFGLINEALKKNYNILYIVFNRSMRNEAKEISKRYFIENKKLNIYTAHGLAYSMLAKTGYFENRDVDNLKALNLIKSNIAKDFESALGILSVFNCFLSSEFLLDETEEFFKNISNDKNSYNIINIINDFKITPEHLNSLIRKIENNHLPCGFDYYLKKCLTLLAKGEINLKYDMVIIDEAQDMYQSILSFAKNLCKKHLILVGDKHQAIYSFTGRVNLLDTLEDTEEAYLTASFRLNEKVTNMANEILRLKGEKNLIKSKQVNTPEKSKAVIGRTNEGLINYYFKLPDELKKRAKFEREIEEIFKFNFTLSCIIHKINPETICHKYKIKKQKVLIESLYHNLKNISHTEIFDYLKNLLLYGQNFSQESDLITAYRLAQDLSPDRILEIINQYNSYKNENKELYIGTVHSCKGKEYREVLILKDLMSDKNHDQYHLNLLYTAVSRASEDYFFPRSDKFK